jgi:hypothetical protein
VTAGNPVPLDSVPLRSGWSSAVTGDNRQILRDLLTNAGYEMTEAVNGEEALAEVAKQRPDLSRSLSVRANC